MLEHFSANRAAVGRLRSGVIGAHLESFVEHLAGLGYARATVSSQLHVLGHLAKWMARRRLSVADLSEPVIGRFLRGRARWTGVHRGDAPTLRRFLAHLRGRGATGPAPDRPEECPLSLLERDYEHYLTWERGFAPATLTNYGGFVRQFLTERVPDWRSVPIGEPGTCQPALGPVRSRYRPRTRPGPLRQGQTGSSRPGVSRRPRPRWKSSVAIAVAPPRPVQGHRPLTER
jgi:hypothetical protein